MYCPNCKNDDIEYQKGQRARWDEPGCAEGWYCPRCGWFGDEYEMKDMFPPEDDL